ncbi:potassium channel family protein [Streptomyces sp. NBC_00154]|uniref:potassium channel family protein n=1 Tax=Streptomyces sp. NBC_00154 TaxID=2975670 RepID=UPI0022544AC2|nr:potassium channel family protein [Streptomyces sp. NBC_00154]MCX5316988.1 potassium channel family protein [Streptomyces sp. NBC_00154]
MEELGRPAGTPYPNPQLNLGPPPNHPKRSLRNQAGGSGLTRTDTLYFAVSTFTTVGFGDITATSEAGHLIVTAQMLLDLLVLVLQRCLF